MREARLYAAEWVLPVSRPPLRDGLVAVEGTRIVWVGPRRELPSRLAAAPVRAFPRSLLLPGWVDAHSHLDLTGALGRIPGTAERFADWLRGVIRFRELCPPRLLRQAITAGLDLLGSTGTTTAAHLSSFPALEPFLEHPMRSVVFHEAIGFPAARAEERLREAEDWLAAAEALIADAGAARVTVGLAPHAPYSVSPALLRGLARLAAERGLPLSVHVAETRAEGEFLRSGGGPLRALLEERGAWDPSWAPPGLSPVRYLAQLGLLDRPGIAVHAHYLDDGDAELLARAGWTVVWCPGSHRFFGHPAPPVPRLLRAGARLALGTDSLASNAGLNMLREVRLAAEALPEVDRAVWLEAATRTGAEALGLGAITGTLEPGKAADLQVLESRYDITDPLATLFEGDLRVRAVLVDGAPMRIR